MTVKNGTVLPDGGCDVAGGECPSVVVQDDGAVANAPETDLGFLTGGYILNTTRSYVNATLQAQAQADEAALEAKTVAEKASREAAAVAEAEADALAANLTAAEAAAAASAAAAKAGAEFDPDAYRAKNVIVRESVDYNCIYMKVCTLHKTEISKSNNVCFLLFAEK